VGLPSRSVLNGARDFAVQIGDQMVAQVARVVAGADPAPMTVVVTLRTVCSPGTAPPLPHRDGDVGRIGDYIEDRRELWNWRPTDSSSVATNATNGELAYQRLHFGTKGLKPGGKPIRPHGLHDCRQRV